MRLFLLLLVLIASPAAASEALWAQLRDAPMVILMRHEATVPGTGDPPGFRLGDCATQRNLSDSGRAAARATGARLRAEGIRVAEVRTSAWCRAEETARLLGFAAPRPDPALNSFFDTRGEEAAATAALRRLVADWSGPGVLVLVSHQVNITAATGISPAQGEMVVLKPAGGTFTLAGRLRL